MTALTSTTTVDLLELPDLGGWTCAWDDLALAAPLPSPFLQSWWFAGTGNGRASFLLVVEGGELLGGLALERRRIGPVMYFRAVGGGKLCPDHLDLLSRPDRVTDVVAELARWFRSRGSRLIDIDGVVADPLLARAITPARSTTTALSVHEYLPTTEATYLDRRSSNFRQHGRRHRRRCTERGITLRRIEEAELPSVLAEFAALTVGRADRRQFSRHLPRFLRTVELAAARGHVRVHVAEKDGRIGVIILCFVVAGRASLYQSARRLDEDFKHAGTVTTLALIGAAIDEGLTELDLLRGEERHKRSLGSERRRLLRLRAAHGPSAHVALGLLEAASTVRQVLGVVRRNTTARGR